MSSTASRSKTGGNAALTAPSVNRQKLFNTVRRTLQAARNNSASLFEKVKTRDTFFAAGSSKEFRRMSVKFAIYAGSGVMAINSTQNLWVKLFPREITCLRGVSEKKIESYDALSHFNSVQLIYVII